MKDYVKSLKTSVGSVVSKPDQVATVLAEMKRIRGTIEGGICVRRFESFRQGSETRYFVVNGVPHAPCDRVPDVVTECARRLQSPFFSIDVAIREDGGGHTAFGFSLAPTATARRCDHLPFVE